jgi:hypothetical protein
MMGFTSFNPSYALMHLLPGALATVAKAVMFQRI